MTKVAKEELDELGDDIDECNVMYLPQVCYITLYENWPCSFIKLSDNLFVSYMYSHSVPSLTNTLKFSYFKQLPMISQYHDIIHWSIFYVQCLKKTMVKSSQKYIAIVILSLF